MERFLRARPVWQEFFPTTKINLVIVSFWTYKRISAFVSPTLLACIGSWRFLFTNVITRAYLHLSKKFHLACKGSSRSIVPKLWNLATLWAMLSVRLIPLNVPVMLDRKQVGIIYYSVFSILSNVRTSLIWWVIMYLTLNSFLNINRKTSYYLVYLETRKMLKI